jgi:hypothetical protein
MNARWLLAPLFLAATLAPGTAPAQTRLSLSGGVLVPFGNLENTTDPSVRVALRAEYQPVNPLGKPKLLSMLLHAAYSDLAVKSEVKSLLTQAGESTDAYLLEVGAGVRVYSRVARFFLSTGAGYVRFRRAGEDGAVDGLDLHGGLGFAFPLGALLGEVEATLHETLVERDEDFQFLAATLGIALPF